MDARPEEGSEQGGPGKRAGWRGGRRAIAAWMVASVVAATPSGLGDRARTGEPGGLEAVVAAVLSVELDGARVRHVVQRRGDPGAPLLLSGAEFDRWRSTAGGERFGHPFAARTDELTASWSTIDQESCVLRTVGGAAETGVELVQRHLGLLEAAQVLLPPANDEVQLVEPSSARRGSPSSWRHAWRHSSRLATRTRAAEFTLSRRFSARTRCSSRRSGVTGGWSWPQRETPATMGRRGLVCRGRVQTRRRLLLGYFV